MEEQVCPLNVAAKAKVETGCKTYTWGGEVQWSDMTGISFGLVLIFLIWAHQEKFTTKPEELFLVGVASS